MRGTGPCPQAPGPGGPQGTLGNGTVQVGRKTRRVEWYTHHLALEITCLDVVGGPVHPLKSRPDSPELSLSSSPSLARLVCLFQLISVSQSCPTLCNRVDCSTPGTLTFLYFC